MVLVLVLLVEVHLVFFASKFYLSEQYLFGYSICLLISHVRCQFLLTLFQLLLVLLVRCQLLLVLLVRCQLFLVLLVRFQILLMRFQFLLVRFT